MNESSNLPEPVCKAFLVCREIVTEPQTGEAVLVGLPMGHAHHRFPTAARVGFFARVTDARGVYEVEVQLQDSLGDIVWRDGPPDRLEMDDPLMYYDMRFNMNVVFPTPGEHEFVLVLGGKPVATQRFNVTTLVPA